MTALSKAEQGSCRSMSQSKKKVLITGANSYIGESVKRYLGQFPALYDIEIIDTIGFKPDV